MNNNTKLMDYIKKIIKEKIKKEIKDNIDDILFEEFKQKYEKLNSEYEKHVQILDNMKNKPMDNNRTEFFKVWSERTNDLFKEKEKLDNEIINRVTKLKLFKTSFFIKFLEKIKYIIKNFLSKKNHDDILERNEVKTKIDVAKDDFNIKDEVNLSIDSKSFETLSQKSLINL